MEEFSPVFERWMEVSLVLALFSPLLFMAGTMLISCQPWGAKRRRVSDTLGAAAISATIIWIVYRVFCYVVYGL